MIDPRKYWTMCRLHDWLYEESDDPAVNREGKASEEELLILRDKSPEHRAVFDAWHNYYFAAGPKPEEPKMER